jgi:hypothetical protein
VAAELVEVAVAKRADLRAPQAGLAEEQHDREVAASAPGAPVGATDAVHPALPVLLRRTGLERAAGLEGGTVGLVLVELRLDGQRHVGVRLARPLTSPHHRLPGPLGVVLRLLALVVEHQDGTLEPLRDGPQVLHKAHGLRVRILVVKRRRRRERVDDYEVRLPAAQQELRQAVAGAHQVLAHVVDAAHEVAKLLVRLTRHEPADSGPRSLPGIPQLGRCGRCGRCGR